MRNRKGNKNYIEYMKGYTKEYRRANPEKTALFRLQTGLNACLKYPEVADEANAKIEEYMKNVKKNG